MLGALALVGLPAALQFLLHPILAGASVWTWAVYWIYTTLGVLVPGTLLALRTLSWRADMLSWLGIGFVLGHCFELVALLLGRFFDDGRLGLLWIPIAYAISILPSSKVRTGSHRWSGTIDAIPHLRQCILALALLVSLGAGTYFALSLPEISTEPPHFSDAWFHLSNAREFRDHSPMQDPRLAGEEFNYHVYGYAASAAVSLATGEGIAPLLLRYSGMTCVFLVILNLFNFGRTSRGGGVVAGAISAFLIIFPIELGLLVAPGFYFAATLPLFGIYLSTTTLAGHVFLVPLLLMLREFYAGMPWRNAWVLALLAFAGAGSKVMFGPVVLCGALGAAGWGLVVSRRLDARRLGAVAFLAIGILPPLLSLMIGEASYSQTIKWAFGSFSGYLDYFKILVEWGVPDAIARLLWLPGFCAPVLLGAAFASVRGRDRGGAEAYWSFAWMSLLAALVPAFSINLLGWSQLFFLYYALTILATLAGVGWVRFARSRFAGPALATVFACWLLIQMTFGFGGRLVLVGEEASTIWERVDSWPEVIVNPAFPRPEARVEPECDRPGCRKLFLTPNVRDALEWARINLPTDAVFVANSRGPGAYGALSEKRAFFETIYYGVKFHVEMQEEAEDPFFEARQTTLDAWWQGRPGFVAELKRAGVTHLFVDRINGGAVPYRHPDLGNPVYSNPDFLIFDLGR